MMPISSMKPMPAKAHDHICLATNHYLSDENRMVYTKQGWLKTTSR